MNLKVNPTMNGSPRHNPSAKAHVCLLLEGTYPYVRGGVSTWVKQIIEGMPELRFSIIFLGAEPGAYDQPAYELPDNLVHIELHYLLGSAHLAVAGNEQHSAGNRRSSRSRRFASNSDLHDQLGTSAGCLEQGVTRQFAELMTGPEHITEAELQSSREAWDTICRKYGECPAGLDFNHYFWTIRGMHAPLFVLADIARHAPEADIYHAVSTGYAGFLGSLLQSRTDRPFLISEHGIYTKERELDLAQVDWIPADLDPFKVGLNDNMGYLRGVWIRFFHSLGRMSYSSATRIFTLYDGNRRRQIADGAPESRLSIIPNGVNVQRFRAYRRPANAAVPPVLALIGRVVPIKDVKTFIRAMRIVRARIPDAQGWLIGPEDEAPAYTLECKALVSSLNMDDCVKFLGFQKPEEIFAKAGLCVLTSVSEGQPLVLLEGFATGIPALTTDVGSCSELVYGIAEDDRALGSAGAVVPIANPARFAEAAIELLSNPAAWGRARDAAIARVETYYDDQDMILHYRNVYQDALCGQSGNEITGNRNPIPDGSSMARPIDKAV